MPAPLSLCSCSCFRPKMPPFHPVPTLSSSVCYALCIDDRPVDDTARPGGQRGAVPSGIHGLDAGPAKTVQRSQGEQDGTAQRRAGHRSGARRVCQAGELLPGHGVGGAQPGSGSALHPALGRDPRLRPGQLAPPHEKSPEPEFGASSFGKQGNSLSRRRRSAGR